MRKLGIYIHIPFCIKKCKYCDFYSVKWSSDLEKEYIASILKEIENYSYLKNYVIDSIYFGGGTPSIISPLKLERVISKIKKNFILAKNCEISMEANPNSINYNLLREYNLIGINRISIGVQSLDDNILLKIGRVHNKNEALIAIENAKKAGFDNINVDVMFNIPDQNVENINNTLENIIKTGITHISFYALKLEEGTPMYQMKKDNKIVMPNEDDERNMYYSGREIMNKNNFFQYEISNFSVRGYECKHNLKYWNQNEYIGIGTSAHSFLNGVRYKNIENIKYYISNISNNLFDYDIQESMSLNDLMFEYIILRLRLTEGLNLNDFNEKFKIDFYEKYNKQVVYLQNNRLVEKIDNYIRLTYLGMDISNYVFSKFMD